jgi:hypothetical protein
VPNKCDVLSEARAQFVEKGEVRRLYFDGECYCAVGYVLKGLGLTNDELQRLGDSRIDTIYNKGRYDSDIFPVSYKAYKAIREADISVYRLQQIQDANDVGDKGYVVTMFDEILVEANCQ